LLISRNGLNSGPEYFSGHTFGEDHFRIQKLDLCFLLHIDSADSNTAQIQLSLRAPPGAKEEEMLGLGAMVEVACP